MVGWLPAGRAVEQGKRGAVALIQALRKNRNIVALDAGGNRFGKELSDVIELLVGANKKHAKKKPTPNRE